MRKAIAIALLLMAACASAPPQWVDTPYGKAVRVVTPSPPGTPKTNPVYPEALRLKRIVGRVSFEVVVDEQGNVLGIESMQATHEEFAKAVLALAKTWTFKPHLVDGKPVKAVYPGTFRFNLD